LPRGERRAAGYPRLLGSALALAWRARRSALAGQVAVTGLSGIAPVAATWLLREILNALTSTGRPHASLVVLVLALGVTGLATAVLSDLGQYLCAQTGRAVQHQTTAALYAAVARQRGLRRLEDPGFQDRLSLAQQTATSGPGQVVICGLSILQSAVTLSGFLAALAALNPVMAAIALAATLPAIYAERGISRRRMAMRAGVSHAQRRQFFYESLLSQCTAAKEIRLFGLGDFFGKRMLGELDSVQREGQQVDRREYATCAGLAALSALVTAGGIWWAVSAAAAGKLTAGDVMLLAAALTSVSSTLSGVIVNGAVTFQALMIFDGYQQILAEEPDLELPQRPVSARTLRRGIQIENVWFRYGADTPWTLRGVTCFIPMGKAVALVGHNGAGKSTLIKLLCHLYDPDRGRILWDGVDVRDMDLAGLRDRVSVVFQDYMAYELTAADNIAVGDLAIAAQDCALESAARKAGIHNSRDLMILDEPSSGLDALAEHEIHNRLREQRHGRTTVLISHRLNTVRDADLIMVLEGGVVSEQGSHHSLMAKSGTYSTLFSLQAIGYASEPETMVNGVTTTKSGGFV
jgi:ATP-binding cassette, subfamily B, bacterial